MNNKFSVIIPAYNCEKTIGKCLDSVLSQEYNLYEIIIVNDGSTDSTLEILNNYKNNKKIKIINKPNSGVSDARNMGMKSASFDWLLFLDSDDWIEPNSFRDLNNLINKYNPDYIITDLIYSNQKNTTYDSIIIDNKKCIIDNIVCIEYSDKKYDGKYKNCRCAGGKLIKKQIVDKYGICFPSGLKKFEDGVFNLNATFASSKVLYSSLQFYDYYYDNPESRMNTFNEDEVNGNKEIFKIVNECLIKEKFKTESLNYLAFFLFILSVDNIMHFDYSRKEKTEKIKKEKEYYFPYFKDINSKYLSFKKRLELSFSKFSCIKLLYLLYYIKVKILKK